MGHVPFACHSFVAILLLSFACGSRSDWVECCIRSSFSETLIAAEITPNWSFKQFLWLADWTWCQKLAIRQRFQVKQIGTSLLLNVPSLVGTFTCICLLTSCGRIKKICISVAFIRHFIAQKCSFSDCFLFLFSATPSMATTKWQYYNTRTAQVCSFSKRFAV